MEAKKCDRCRKYFDIEDEYLEIEITHFKNRWQNLPNKFELCYECQREIENFLGIRPKREGE